MNSQNNFRTTLGVVGAMCLLALVVYPLWWGGLAPLRYPDTDALTAVVEDLQDGRMDDFHDRSVGVPVLMLIFGTGKGFLYFSLLSYLGALVLLAYWMQRLGMSRIAVVLATAILLLPTYIQIGGMLMTECAAAVILIAALVPLTLYLDKGATWLLAVSALAIGVSAYIRPSNQLLGLAIAGALFLMRGQGQRYMRAAVAVGCASVVLVGAYVAFNKARFGWAALTNSTGYHLGTRTITVLDRISDPELKELAIQARNDLFTSGGNHTQTWYRVRRELKNRGVSELDAARRVQKETTRLILTSPLAYVAIVMEAFPRYLQPFQSRLTASGAKALPFSALHFVLIGAFFLVQVVVWGGYLMARYVGRSDFQVPLPAAWVLTTLVIAYTMLISCAADIGEPRYRVVTDPLIVFSTLHGLHILTSMRRQARIGANSKAFSATA